jgi:hypothetical protein
MRTSCSFPNSNDSPPAPQSSTRNGGFPRLSALGTAYAEYPATGVTNDFREENIMSNLQSVLGGAVWMAVATLLMLATFEPAPSPIGETEFAAVKIAAGFADI